MEENHGHEEYELNKYSSYYFYEDSEPLTEEQLTALRYSSDLIATNTLPTAADKNTGAPKLLNNNLLSSQELGSDASSTGYAYNHADESAPLPTPVNNTLTTSNGATDSAAGYSYNSSDLDSLPKASEVSSSDSGSIKQSSERVTGYSYNTEEENSSSYVDNTQQDSDDKSTQPANTEQASDGYSYVDNSQHEDTSNANTNSVTKTEVRSASGYSYYAGDDSKSSESVYIDNANYHQPSIDKKPAKQVDDLKKLSPVSTSTATPTPPPDLKNWTIDYFSLQNKLYHKVTNTKGPIATSGLEPIADIDATQDFIDIAEDFAKIALEVGQQIIEEKFLPKSKQTILPINAGGIAGGVKYIHRGIFFKFALDEHNIYGGSVERASKAAAHELKGIQALIDWEFKGVGLFTIKFPLTAVIDYRGFRLVATTILPLNSKTLVYGSPDGGKTFNTPDPQRPSAVQLEELLQAWGRYLNLKPHEMNYNGVLKRVCITFDLEGHIGTDGHLYCCDFARVLPPVKPDPKMRGSFLYRLFRLEFCRKYFKPLVADGFLKQLVDAKTNNGEIMEATNYLLYQLIPQTAVMFEKIPCHLSIRELMVLIHQRGINFRYTWLVAHLLKRDDFKRLLYTEIVARTLKHMLNDSFRASGATMSDTYHRLIAELFNKAFGPNNAEFWTQTLPNEVTKWFDCPDSTFVAMSRSMVDGNMSPLDVLTEQTDQVMQQIDDLTEKLYSPYIPRYANYYKGKYIPRTKKNPEEKKPRASPKKSTSTRGRGRGRKATPSKKLTESAYHDKDLGEYDDDYDAEKDSEPKQLTESVQSDQPATPTRRSTRTRRTSTIQADTVDLSDVHEYDGAPAGRRSRRGSRTSVPSSPLREYGEVRDPNKVPSNTNTPPASPLRTDSQGTATPTSQQSQQSTPASSLRNSLNQPPSPAQLPNMPPPVIEKHMVDVAALADRLLSMMSITINPNKKAEIELLLSQGGHVTLDAEDVQDYTPKVKHLFLNLFQHGYFLKARANKAVDLETHINLLEQSRDMYLKCLEMCSMNDFALHNYGRVLNELSKLYVNNPEKKHTVEFLAVWMTKLAHHINQDLKQYDGDVYRYFDVYERDGRVKQVANTPWCREECMTRFVLMEDELRHAVYDAELIEEYYKSLFDEFKHPLHGTVEIHVALSACKILFRHSENKLHAELWSNFIKELDVTSINHLNQEEWDTVFDMLRPILFEVKE